MIKIRWTNRAFRIESGSGACQVLITRLQHSLHAESYLGSGAVMGRKMPALRSIGITLHGWAIADFACDHPGEMIHDCIRISELVHI